MDNNFHNDCAVISGETAPMTMKVVNKARGATLLIDEAYQLNQKDLSCDFGIEAIEAVMSTIEGSDMTTDDRPAYILLDIHPTWSVLWSQIAVFVEELPIPFILETIPYRKF